MEECSFSVGFKVKDKILRKWIYSLRLFIKNIIGDKYYEWELIEKKIEYKFRIINIFEYEISRFNM